MRIAVFGAGAIGTYLAVALHQAGAQVTVIARGQTLAAIRTQGVTRITKDKRITADVLACADAREAGPQDCVIVALKSQDFPGAAEHIASLTRQDTMLVTAMNGIPYWYFHAADPAWRGRAIQSVDPGGRLLRLLPPEMAVGCVIYCFAEIVAPGVVDQSGSDRIILGEPDGTMSPRIRALAAILEKGGLEAPVTPTIRDEIWGKLWGNLSMNPLSALTGATMDRLTSDPDLRGVALGMMVEAAETAKALGIVFPMDVDERIRIAGRAGARKTSMLQDAERGRPLEIEAILGAVVELGTLTGHPMPLCRAILALARERGRNLKT
jgi:2-dehydropantoate 2-reductase